MKTKPFIKNILMIGLLLITVGFVVSWLFIETEGIFRFKKVASESMLPTLKPGQRFLSEQVSLRFSPLERGEIVLYYPPDAIIKPDPLSKLGRWLGFSLSIDGEPDKIPPLYLSRVIGLPGDKLTLKPNLGVWINGEKLNEPYVYDVLKFCENPDSVVECQYPTVQQEQYFLLSDNRNNAVDSRLLGTIDKSRIIGKVSWRF